MPPSTTALRALSGYRRLFRARRQLFAGDDRALSESRLAIRAEFDRNRHVVGPPDRLEGMLAMIDDAEDMLLNGIVRGELNIDRNVVEVKIGSNHEARMDGNTMTHVDPITSETGADMMMTESGGGKKTRIEVTSTRGGGDGGSR